MLCVILNNAYLKSAGEAGWTRTGKPRRTFLEKVGEGRVRSGEAKPPSPGEGGAREG